ncbi:MAG: phage holin family protein [Actinomycetota bacterium]|nr:phage holin family protein [Actinomycetota bacterium]
MSTQHQVTEPTVGRLAVEASRDLSALIRYEIALAKSELRVSVKAGGLGLGLLAVAALFGLLALVLLSFAFVYFVDLIPGVNLPVSFLIVFAVYLVIAAVLALLGQRKVKQVRAPERTITQAQRSKEILPGKGPARTSEIRAGDAR